MSPFDLTTIIRVFVVYIALHSCICKHRESMQLPLPFQLRNWTVTNIRIRHTDVSKTNPFRDSSNITFRDT